MRELGADAAALAVARAFASRVWTDSGDHSAPPQRQVPPSASSIRKRSSSTPRCLPTHSATTVSATVRSAGASSTTTSSPTRASRSSEARSPSAPMTPSHDSPTRSPDTSSACHGLQPPTRRTGRRRRTSACPTWIDWQPRFELLWHLVEAAAALDAGDLIGAIATLSAQEEPFRLPHMSVPAPLRQSDDHGAYEATLIQFIAHAVQHLGGHGILP